MSNAFRGVFLHVARPALPNGRTAPIPPPETRGSARVAVPTSPAPWVTRCIIAAKSPSILPT